MLTCVRVGVLGQAGDEVLQINDLVVTDMKLAAVTQLILGPTGSKVCTKSARAKKQRSTRREGNGTESEMKIQYERGSQPR